MTRKKTRKRRRFKAEEKFEIVKQVVTKAKSVSAISKEHGIHPNQIYKWQKLFFDAALTGFKENANGRTIAAEKRKNEKHKNEIQTLNSVISAIMQENIELKKNDLD
jgi:transposase-like protein